MAILTFPNIQPESFEWGISYISQVSSSPLTGYVQTLEIPGARWKARLSYSDLTPAEGRELMAFLTRLRGMSGRFYLSDLSLENNQGDSTATKVVAAGSGGSTLILDSDVTPNLVPGDYVRIGSDVDREVKMIVQRTGAATYTIAPNIRMAAPVGENVFMHGSAQKAECVMMLTSDEQASWPTTTKARLSSIDIECVEVYEEP